MSLLRMSTSKGRRYRSNSAEVQNDQGSCWKKQAMGWCQYHPTKNLRMVGESVVSQGIHSTNAHNAPEKSGHTAGVLLEYTCAALAFPTMSLRRQVDCNAPVDSPFLIRSFEVVIIPCNFIFSVNMGVPLDEFFPNQ